MTGTSEKRFAVIERYMRAARPPNVWYHIAPKAAAKRLKRIMRQRINPGEWSYYIVDRDKPAPRPQLSLNDFCRKYEVTL